MSSMASASSNAASMKKVAAAPPAPRPSDPPLPRRNPCPSRHRATRVTRHGRCRTAACEPPMTEPAPARPPAAPPAEPPVAEAAGPSAAAYVLDEPSEMAMLRSFSNLGFNDANVRRGGADAAIADLARNKSPRILVVDVSGMPEPMAAINRLADVCNPATEVIVVGDRNDIVLYRDMKAAGVAEDFFKPLISTVVTRGLSK